MKDTSFFNRILTPKSEISVKSFAMFLTTILGFILGIMLGVSIIMDAKDGKIDTDLYGASAFVISIGALVSLSSAPKTIIDNTRAKIEAKMKENDPEPKTGDEES